MNPTQIFLSGIAPEHVPALLAPLVLLAFWLVRRRLPLRISASAPAPPVAMPIRVFAWLMATSAAVHVALPLGHQDAPLWTVAFLASGAAYGWLAYRALAGKRYRTLSVLLILATLVAYLVAVLSGNEDSDQVGIATALVELVALGLCLVPVRTPERPRRVRRVFGSIAFTFVVVVTGVSIWGGALAKQVAAGAGGIGSGGSAAGHEHAGHHHAAGARAQAGVLMLPHDDAVPTPDQVRGAAVLVDRTRAGLARFADIHAAIAAGYRPTTNRMGYDVHMENPAYAKDGRILDPDRPEQLMYAIADGKATLLSAVFAMRVAGTAAPAPGGPLTHWHSHNICVTVLPPGFTLVDAYGGCPAFALKVASPLMMHVWVVDNPGGPYADGAPDTWTRPFNLAHGVPFTW
ncbi:MAG: hypothetical protein AUI14_11035 [Actinobacteria bacterium 13_2_20CM_2_71_6]|nr:MAG: hypothetical protein AUI14_11035 [Actinobacteria bacterium 13_2_20CM_2_71_6]